MSEFENMVELRVDFDPFDLSFTWVGNHTPKYREERMRILCMYFKKNNSYREILLKPKPSRFV